MPELPEVESARLSARKVAVGRRIVGVWCADDRIVFDRVSPARVRRALVGKRVLGVHRHGKHLWFELDQRPWPCLHFGMTGGFHVPGRKSLKLKSSGERQPREGWPPRFAKLRLTFDDGGELVFADARRLGRVRLRHDPRSAPIKAVLLDQSVAAGVGNWIADEVLYQAGVDPRRRASTLTDAELRRVRDRIRSVVATAVRYNSDSDRFPRRWLFHDRWGKKALAMTSRGERILYTTVGGRTTAWVPTVQR